MISTDVIGTTYTTYTTYTPGTYNSEGNTLTEYAQEVQRSAGLVPAMATALGMTDAQIDALFVTASTL